MTETISLGQFRGIRLGAHWSVLVIGWLLAWTLAADTFPAEAPGSSAVVYWSVATVTVCVFWACLMAHEISHSLVATKCGVQVDGITLWLLGGVSRLHGEASRPEDELRIAIAGPAVSVSLAIVGGVLALGANTLGAPDLLVASVTWLALINGVLAVFNLLPAAPLDGGRILHALVWRRSHDRSHATVVATNAGRTFGYILIGLGLLLFLAGDFGGLWFAFIGWFVLTAARAEATHVLVHDALAGVRVRDVMTPDPITAPARTSIADLLDDYFLQHHCAAFPLVDDTGRVVALITLRQVKSVAAARRSELTALELAWPVADVPRAAPEDGVIDVLDRLGETAAGDGRALVFEGGALVGIVSPTDLNRALEIARLRSPTAPVP